MFVDFVDPRRAQEYECAVCMDTYKDPVQIGCQDHIFCKKCIDQLISIKGNSFRCPLCKVQCTSNDVTHVKFVARQIGDLQVKCTNGTTNKKFMDIGSQKNENESRKSVRFEEKSAPQIGKKRRRSLNNEDDNEDDDINHNKRRKLNDNESCQWKGSYSELDNHIKKCPLQLVSCEHCSISILRRELNEHYDTCPEFPLQCFQCDEEHIARNHMALHISEVCPITIISCDECKQGIKRKDKILHLENECPESLIECAFYRFGCKDKLKRKDEKKHIENAAFTHNHLVQIANHQLKLKNEIKSLKEK
eukprot:206847_1